MGVVSRICDQQKRSFGLWPKNRFSIMAKVEGSGEVGEGRLLGLLVGGCGASSPLPHKPTGWVSGMSGGSSHGNTCVRALLPPPGARACTAGLVRVANHPAGGRTW